MLNRTILYRKNGVHTGFVMTTYIHITTLNSRNSHDLDYFKNENALRILEASFFKFYFVSILLEFPDNAHCAFHCL